MGAPLASVAVVARTVAQLWNKPIIGKLLVAIYSFFCEGDHFSDDSFTTLYQYLANYSLKMIIIKI
jgi:hypothetical protein